VWVGWKLNLLILKCASPMYWGIIRFVLAHYCEYASHMHVPAINTIVERHMMDACKRYMSAVHQMQKCLRLKLDVDRCDSWGMSFAWRDVWAATFAKNTHSTMRITCPKYTFSKVFHSFGSSSSVHDVIVTPGLYACQKHSFLHTHSFCTILRKILCTQLSYIKYPTMQFQTTRMQNYYAYGLWYKHGVGEAGHPVTELGEELYQAL
jgi:hypothetical protein